MVYRVKKCVHCSRGSSAHGGAGNLFSEPPHYTVGGLENSLKPHRSVLDQNANGGDFVRYRNSALGVREQFVAPPHGLYKLLKGIIRFLEGSRVVIERYEPVSGRRDTI